jgi:hypothetical protein
MQYAHKNAHSILQDFGTNIYGRAHAMLNAHEHTKIWDAHEHAVYAHKQKIAQPCSYQTPAQKW